MGDVETLLRFWRALDDLTGTVRPTAWGAVVTDPRIPDIWDANYARVEARDRAPSVEEVEAELLPALEQAGARHVHTVVFFPELIPDVLTGFSGRGDRLTWDAVMALRRDATAREPRDVHGPVEELDHADPAFWARHRETLAGFGVEGAAADQLELFERDLGRRGGKRWFGIREGSDIVTLGSLLVLERIGYVDGVFTFPAVRGRGYAETLARGVVDEARRSGAREVLLLVQADGGPTGLYERTGFEVVGRIAGTLRRR